MNSFKNTAGDRGDRWAAVPFWGTELCRRTGIASPARAARANGSTTSERSTRSCAPRGRNLLLLCARCRRTLVRSNRGRPHASISWRTAKWRSDYSLSSAIPRSICPLPRRQTRHCQTECDHRLGRCGIADVLAYSWGSGGLCVRSHGLETSLNV